MMSTLKTGPDSGIALLVDNASMLGEDLSFLQIPDDQFGHNRIRDILISLASRIEDGSIISLEGEWGRGKTDVLVRVAESIVSQQSGSAGLVAPIWVSPWRYGSSNLLIPIVSKLTSRVSAHGDAPTERFKKAAKSLALAGARIGARAVPLALPFLKTDMSQIVLEELKEVAPQLSEALLPGVEQAPDDSGFRLANEFATLVKELKDKEQWPEGARLLMIVDDLDRCPPSQQIAILESLHFILSHRAPLVTLLAVDRSALRTSIKVHYKNDSVNADLYLSKLLAIALQMPRAIPTQAQSHLQLRWKEFRRRFPGEYAIDSLNKDLRGSSGAGVNPFMPDMGSWCHSPREIIRFVDQFGLLAMSSVAMEHYKEMKNVRGAFELLCATLAISLRHPEMRQCFQRVKLFNIKQSRSGPSEAVLLSLLQEWSPAMAQHDEEIHAFARHITRHMPEDGNREARMDELLLDLRTCGNVLNSALL